MLAANAEEMKTEYIADTDVFCVLRSENVPGNEHVSEGTSSLQALPRNITGMCSGKTGRRKGDTTRICRCGYWLVPLAQREGKRKSKCRRLQSDWYIRWWFDNSRTSSITNRRILSVMNTEPILFGRCIVVTNDHQPSKTVVDNHFESSNPVVSY